MSDDRLAEIRMRIEAATPHVNQYRLAEDILDIRDLLHEVERLRAVNADQSARLQFVAEGLGKTLVRMGDNTARRLSDLEAELHLQANLRAADRQR